jgi:subtilisin family serine protease
MRTATFALAVILLCASNLGAVINEDYPDAQSQEMRLAEGVVIVNFQPHIETNMFSANKGTASTGILEVDRVFSERRVNNLEKLFEGSQSPDKIDVVDLSRYYRIEFDKSENLDSVMAELRACPGVAHVEPVGVHPVAVAPDDPLYYNQWHHNRASDYDIDSPEAWDVESGDSSVVVAIVDTGVLWDHPDLAGPDPFTDGNIWINWAEYNGEDGVDDDNNGYIDDYRGWDWVSVTGAWAGEDGTSPDNDPTDFNGHGTHCAGIAAAITNNGLGVAGVAGGFSPNSPGVKIMSLRVGWSAPHPTYGYETGYVRMDFCAQAFYYAADNGADVISCSWGSSNSGGISAALNYAVQNDVIVCKAAGNESSTYADFLCDQPTVVSVASTTSSDTKSSFSNYGGWVDISAPGSSIYATYSDHGTDTFAYLSGTSMACPMAAGVCALIRSRDTSLGRDDVVQILFNTADDIDDRNPGLEGLLGAGRINSASAVSEIVYAVFDGNPRIGWPPVEVDFVGSSPFDVQQWKYYFGDGDSSLQQNPSHIYSQPGAYNVTLDISTAIGDNSTTADNYIVVLADTVDLVDYTGFPGVSQIEVPINLTNEAPVSGMILPISYSGDLDLTFQNYSFEGSRTEYFEVKQISAINTSQKIVVFELIANDGGGAAPLPAGSGEIMKLYFGPEDGSSGTTEVGFTVFYDDSLVFDTPVGEYVPEYSPGVITVSGGLRGDANGDEVVDVSDAVYIINYAFVPGSPAPDTFCGGDANNDDSIDVSDAVFVVNYAFIQGAPEPEPCD